MMRSQGRNSGKKTAFLGVMTALALILSYVEALVPVPVPVPGMKLGLANLAAVLLLYMAGWREALLVNLARIVLAGFLFGNLSSILYGLSGALLSFLVMCLLKRTGRFSAVGVSLAGGSAHNLGQLLAAVFVTENTDLFYYAPVLLMVGEATGALIGLLAAETAKRLPGNKIKEIV